MKTLHVGGVSLFNRYKDLSAALSAARDDYIIELHKSLKDVSAVADKNVTIHGNGHTLTPAPGTTALNCTAFITLKDLNFECLSRTNALVIHAGGTLKNITTRIKGPARALYPTIIQDGGTLELISCNMMHIETICPDGCVPALDIVDTTPSPNSAAAHPLKTRHLAAVSLPANVD